MKNKNNKKEEVLTDKVENIPIQIPIKDENVLDNQISMEEVLAGIDLTKNVDQNIDSIVNEENRAKALMQADETVVKQKSAQKKIWSFVFLVINVVVVAIILLGMLEGQNITAPSELTINAMFMVITLLTFPLIDLIEQLRYGLLIKKATKRNRPFLAYKVGVIGRYYDYITPLGTGGQPFQIYYLKNRGVKASSAISIPLARYISQQTVFAILSFILLIGSLTFFKETFTDGTGSTLISVASWIGFALNSFIILITLILSSSKLGHKFVIGILKLLKKLRIVKNYDKYYVKLIKTVEEYQRTMKFFAKSPKLLIAMVLYSLFIILIQYTIPFLIYCAFGNEPSFSMWIQIVIVSLMIELACSFIPLPGGSGAAELSFAALFTSLFATGTFWAMLLWRLLTYYAFVIQGIIIIVYDYVYGNKKNERMLKKMNLDEQNEEINDI